MSSASTGQRDQRSRPEVLDAGSGRPAADAPALPPGRGWITAAAKYAPVGACATAMAVLGVWGLERQSSMGNDEVATHWAALLSLHQLARLLGNVDAVHGFYYLLMHGWVAVGTSPAVMRIPSVIAMTAAVAMTAIIARRLTGSALTALFAGLTMALTPDISYYAQTARSYALVMACVLGSTLALLHAMKADAEGVTGLRLVWPWVSYGALVTLGGYLNELSLLVLAAHAVTLALARYGRRAVLHWARAAAVSAVLVAPLVVIGAREVGAVGWIPYPHLWELRVLFRDYFGPVIPVAVLLVGCAVVAVLPAGAWWRRRTVGEAAGQSGAEPEPAWWRRGGVSLPSVAVPLLVLPATLLILESLIARPLYVDRYVLYGEAGAALLVGAGAYRIGSLLAAAANRPGLVVLPGVIVCSCALALQLGPQQRARTPQSRLFDFGGPSRYVAAHARPGDGVLYFSDFYRKAELGYPGDFGKVSDFSLAVPPVRTGTFTGQDKPLATILALMPERQRIWVLGLPPSALLPTGPLRAESLVLMRNFTLSDVQHFRGVVATLWLRR